MRQSWAWRRVSLSSSRARQRRKRSEKGVLEIPSGKVVGSAAQAIAPGGRKGWPPASPRTFAWSARAHHERQQTTRHRRSFVARRGRDWPVKTASTFAVGARGKPTEPRMAPLGASCCIVRSGHGASEMLGGQIRALRSDRTRQCRCSRPVDIDCPLSDTAGFAKHRTFGDSDKS